MMITSLTFGPHPLYSELSARVCAFFTAFNLWTETLRGGSIYDVGCRPAISTDTMDPDSWRTQPWITNRPAPPHIPCAVSTSSAIMKAVNSIYHGTTRIPCSWSARAAMFTLIAIGARTPARRSIGRVITFSASTTVSFNVHCTGPNFELKTGPASGARAYDNVSLPCALRSNTTRLSCCPIRTGRAR